MADLPRDPRQLARDILSGKISIEELAREQARRAGGGLRVPPAPQARVPDRIPLPRTAQAPSLPPPRPVQRPVQRQVPPPPRPVIRQSLPKQPSRVVVHPVPQRRAEPVPSQPVQHAAVSETPGSVRAMTPQDAAVKAPNAGQLGLGKVMRNKMALRQCIVMAEVLGKPLGLRDEW